MARDKLGMNGHDPEKRGENWPKFLKEMQTLGPVIDKRLGGVMPENRAQARGNGRKNLDDFLRKETERLAGLEKFRSYKINKWFDDNLEKVNPRLIHVLRHYPKIGAFFIKAMGYKLTATDGTEAGVPFTVCTITRFGRLKVGLRMFWEDPKKGGLSHERR